MPQISIPDVQTLSDFSNWHSNNSMSSSSSFFFFDSNWSSLVSLSIWNWVNTYTIKSKSYEDSNSDRKLTLHVLTALKQRWTSFISHLHERKSSFSNFWVSSIAIWGNKMCKSFTWLSWVGQHSNRGEQSLVEFFLTELLNLSWISSSTIS